MLADICARWPPQPGPNEPQTGTKRTAARVPVTYTETLIGLHNPAWWTGLKISHDQELPPLEFRVRLLDHHSMELFDYGNQWTQASHQWTPFPWPIPAAMATTMGLHLEITSISDSTDSHFLITTTGFQEMRDLLVRDRYLFVTADGSAIGHWNGLTKEHDAGSLSVRCLHHVVPPMDYLLNKNQNQNHNSFIPFCIHDWTERVPP